MAIRGDIGGKLRREARERGDTKYFTGQPCKYGHVCGRYTQDGHCAECANARTSQINKEKRRGPNGDNWRAQALAARRIWLQKPGVKEMLLEKGKHWSVASRQRHPIEYRVYWANKRALRYDTFGVSGIITVDEVKDLLKKQKLKCAECFEKLKKDFHIDHKVPLSRGGPNKIGNIQGLCAPCNAAKHCADHLEWARLKGRLL